jgi:hypothetical protein
MAKEEIIKAALDTQSEVDALAADQVQDRRSAQGPPACQAQYTRRTQDRRLLGASRTAAVPPRCHVSTAAVSGRGPLPRGSSDAGDRLSIPEVASIAESAVTPKQHGNLPEATERRAAAAKREATPRHSALTARAKQSSNATIRWSNRYLASDAPGRLRQQGQARVAHQR